MIFSEIFNKIIYAIVFGFMGLIIGIWFADLLYSIVLKNLNQMTTTYLSVGIIILVILSASIFGALKGKYLLE